MGWRFNHALILLAALVIYSPQVISKPVEIQYDRFVIDWSRLRVRFYGQSSALLSEQMTTYRDQELKAWSEGLSYFVKAFPELAQTWGLDPQEAQKIAAQRRTSVVSRNTTYYTDLNVQVLLENSMPSLVAPLIGSQSLSHKESLENPQDISNASSPKSPAVVFELDKFVVPTPVYVISDERGQVLWSWQRMHANELSQHLTGRWFARPVGALFHQYAGKTPLRVSLKVQRSGHFLINSRQWDELMQSAGPSLRHGRIIFLLPGNGK